MATPIPTWTERIRKYIVETFENVTYATGGVTLTSKILGVVEEAAVLEIIHGGTVILGCVTAVGIGTGSPNGVKVKAQALTGSELPSGETITVKLLLGGA